MSCTSNNAPPLRSPPPSPSHQAADYSTGDAAADLETSRLVASLVDAPELRSACPVPFDENQLWREQHAGKGGEGGPKHGPMSPAASATLHQALRETFRNVSSVMDCVACEKCKVWGKSARMRAGSGGGCLLLHLKSFFDACLKKAASFPLLWAHYLRHLPSSVALPPYSQASFALLRSYFPPHPAPLQASCRC